MSRFLFMLCAFGATDVSIVNGGMDKWVAEGRETTAEVPTPEPSDGTGWELRDGAVYTLEGVHKLSAAILANEEGAPIIIDSRGAASVEKETVVGAVNVPTTGLWNEDLTLKSDDEVRQLFSHTEVETRPVVFTCGAGIFATVGAFCLARLGYGHNIGMYDGSFSEYKKYKVPDFSDPNWEANFTRQEREE